MRKQISSVCLSLLISAFIFSQDRRADVSPVGQSSFFAEAGGPGVAFSANIDKRFKPGRLGWGGRIGVGFVSAWNDHYDPVTGYYNGGPESAITFPAQLNYIFGKENSNHTFEVGGGLTYVTKRLEFLNFWDDKSTRLLGTFCFMYRRQPKGGGFSWRAGFTPLVGKNYIQAFGAASVGYNF
jgi:hypothetical protein